MSTPSDAARAGIADRTPPATARDRLRQGLYRLGFPLARALWRLSRRRHVGALVAVYVDDALLLLRPSYRAEWTLPGGGVHPGETPREAAQRELREETGLSAVLEGPATVVAGRWDGLRDQVHVFRVALDAAPAVRLDNREIVAGRLATPAELAQLRLTGPLQAYLDATLKPA